MSNNYSFFMVPTFEREEVYNFDATDSSMSVFEELNAIAEEIERCRAKNM